MRLPLRTVRIVIVSMLGATPVICQTSMPAKPNTDNYSGEPYVMESLRNSVKFEKDGKGQRELTFRVRLQSESAVREFGLLVYPFMASFESLDVVYVRVRKSDGSVIETPSSEVQELDSAVSREAPMYTDQREKHIAVKSLGVGDILEADVRWTIHDPIAPGHFWHDQSFFDDGICLDEQLEINVPTDLPVKVIASNATPQVRREGSRQIYVFHSSRLKREKEKDKDQEIPAWEKNVHGVDPPAVRVSAFSSWAEVGAWYGGLQKPRVEVTPRIRSTAEEITKGKTTDEEKLRAIYDYVASRYRYIGIDLGSGRYTPHAAEDVLANRYGDCKDKHTLFAALLQAVGIHAYPALISSNFKLDPAMPSASLFDHVITAIPRGDSFFFLDTTPEVAPYGLLLAGLRDRQALVIPANGPARLVTTPANPPLSNRQAFRMDASIDAKGTLDGKGRFEYRGDSEVVLRAAYRNTPQNRWKDLTQAIVANLGFGGTVSEVSAAQPEKTADPFWVSYDYHRVDYSNWKAHQITLPFPPLFLPELNDAEKKSQDPLPLGSPQEIVYETSLKLPEGAGPVVPPSVDEKNDFSEYTATYSYDKGILRGTRRLVTTVREIPGSQRNNYTALVKAIREDAEHWIFLAGNFETESPLRKARALLGEGKAADAILLLGKALEEDPNNQQLMLTLGIAYLRTDDANRADGQFKKLLTGKPTAAMLNSIAYEYVEANRRLNDAVDYASRAVAETSAQTAEVALDSAVSADYLRMTELASHWDTLGWAKFRLGDTAGAEKYLESAWKLWQRAVIGKHLAEVYEKQGKKREADHLCLVALTAPGLDDEPYLREKLQEIQKRLGITKPETGTANGKAHRPPPMESIELSEMRAVKVPRKIEVPEGVKNAIFAVAIENGESRAQTHFMSGDKQLKLEADALAAADFHQPFPDASAVKILRAGWLSCSKYSKDCTMVFFQVNDAPSISMLARKPD